MQIARSTAGRPTVTASAHGSQGTVRSGEVARLCGDTVPAAAGSRSETWSHPANQHQSCTSVGVTLLDSGRAAPSILNSSSP